MQDQGPDGACSAVGAARGSSRATTSAMRELLSDHGGALEYRALAGAETVQAGGEERLHGRRQ